MWIHDFLLNRKQKVMTKGYLVTFYAINSHASLLMIHCFSQSISIQRSFDSQQNWVQVQLSESRLYGPSSEPQFYGQIWSSFGYQTFRRHYQT